MLCEQNHISIRSVEKGLAPEKAYKNACVYDDAFDRRVSYAFDNRLGFLNQNPMEIGTGMRVSAVMHLPALSQKGEMTHISSTISKLGFRIRGYYGDSSSIKGDVFNISNIISMGLSEAEAISNLKAVVLQLEAKERDAAAVFIQNIAIRDRIQRAFALLQNAMILSTDEMFEMLSWVRLGAVNGLCNVSTETLDGLFTLMQPACIDVAAGRKLSGTERDELRAKKVRDALQAVQ